jgi:hypothetical protein
MVDKAFHGKGSTGTDGLHIAICKKIIMKWFGWACGNITGEPKFYENMGLYFRYTHDFPIGNTPQTDWWFWKFL